MSDDPNHMSPSARPTPPAASPGGPDSPRGGSSSSDDGDSSGDDGGGSANALILEVLDRMIERFSGGADLDQVTAARREYDQRRGRVFEDEPLWESWTQSFLEWYVVERLEGAHAPVAQYLAEAGIADEGSRVRAAVRGWLTSHRSLFEVASLRAGEVQLIDLLGGGRFSVAERRAIAGVAPGDVAELRLVGFEQQVLFGRTFCFHPRGTRESIERLIERLTGDGQSRQAVMDTCASLRIRCERYRHVAPTRIYQAAATGSARAPLA